MSAPPLIKHQRELDESSSAKSDIRDAFTIGNIVREGKYIDTVIEDGVFRQLRSLAHVRERILRYSIGSTHGLQAVMKALLTEIPLAEYILSLPGMGPVSCGVFLGELEP